MPNCSGSGSRKEARRDFREYREKPGCRLRQVVSERSSHFFFNHDVVTVNF